MAKHDVVDVDMEDMDEALGGGMSPQAEEVQEPAANVPDAAPPSHPAVMDEGVYLDPKTGFPNPMRIPLTECHLPRDMVNDKTLLLKYVGRHYPEKARIMRLSPSINEQTLYAKYQQITRGGVVGKRPVSLRPFCAAVRCIKDGKPIEPPAEPNIDDLAL